MRVITDKKAVSLLFFSCWIAYFCAYLGRMNYSAAMPALLAGGLLEKTEAGFIATLYFAFYATGQVVNGFLGDRVSPRVFVTAGLVLAGLSNALMGVVGQFWAMAIFWAINGYTQSTIWPSVVRIFSQMLKREKAVDCLTNISSSIALGTLGSYLLSALVINFMGWRFAFLVPAGIMFCAGAVFFVTFGKIERHAEQYGENAVIEDNKDMNKADRKRQPFAKVLLSASILAIIIPTVIYGVLKDGITAWVPTYINENFNTGPAFSVLLSMVLPIVNISGAYMARFSRRLAKGEIKQATIFFTSALVALILIQTIGHLSMILTVCLLAVITASMFAINTIFISYVPIHYASKGLSSTLSGFLNAAAYAGAAISSVTIGVLVGRFGWGNTFTSFIIIAIISVTICLLNRKRHFG